MPRYRGPGACGTRAPARCALSPCIATESVVVAPLGCERDVIFSCFYDGGGYSCPAVVALVRAALEPLYTAPCRRVLQLSLSWSPLSERVRARRDVTAFCWRRFLLPPHRGPCVCSTGALVPSALSPCTTTESVVVASLREGVSTACRNFLLLTEVPVAPLSWPWCLRH